MQLIVGESPQESMILNRLKLQDTNVHYISVAQDTTNHDTYEKGFEHSLRTKAFRTPFSKGKLPK